MGEGPGALGPDPSAETTPGGRVSQASGPEPPTPPMSPTQMWMNVPQAWPSVPTAASTLMGPLSVYATQATSWVLMAGSATVSGQWAITPRGVEGPAGQHSSPVPAHHGCQLALAEGQRFLVNQGQCWAWGLRVGPGRVGGGRETPGGQRVPEPAWPRSSVLPVSQQGGSGWGREGRAGSGCHPSPVPRPWGGSRRRDRDGDSEQLRGGQRRLLPQLQPQQHRARLHLPPRLRAGRGPEDVHWCAPPPSRAPHPQARDLLLPWVCTWP